AFAGDRTKSRVLSVLLLLVIIAIPLTPMLAWKIAPHDFTLAANKFAARLLWTTFPAFGFADALFGLVLPLGLSIASFRALDLLLKVHLGILEPVTLDRVLYYGFFPPILALGPIAEYEEVRVDKTTPRIPHPVDLSIRLFRIAFGAIKIFVIGHALDPAAAWVWRGGEA